MPRVRDAHAPVSARPVAWALIAAALVAAVSLAVPHDAATSVAGIWGLAAGCALAGALLLRLGTLRPRAMSGVLVLATATITASILASGGAPNAASVLYTWVALYAAYALSMRVAVIQAALASAAYGALLIAEGVTTTAAHWTTTTAAIVGAAVLAGAMRRRLDATLTRLDEQANTDALTGLPNRRRFNELLEDELARDRRHHDGFAVLLADVDEFKAVNDTYGHPRGDRALVLVADALRDSIREVDTPARLGGDEFGVLLPRSDAEAAEAVAHRIRARADELLAAEGLRVSVSIGAAAGSDDAEELLHLADEALYAAKRTGGTAVAPTGGRPRSIR